MAEVEHWKRMYAESGRDFFLLKYKKIELEKRVNELENQEALRLIDELDLKHLLEDVKIKYDGLLVEFQEKKIECEMVKSELKELSESKIGVGNGLKEYQIMCNRWKERRNKSLEEEKRIASEREKKENERIISLEKEIMKMGSDQREKCDEFNKEIMDLECAKRKAEDEIEIWKKKFTDSEGGKQRAKDEMEVWKEEFTNFEYANRRAEDEIEIWKQKFADSECGKTRVEGEIEVWKKKFTDSECANRRAEDAIEIWKQELEGLESERTRAGVEINLLKIKCMELEIQAGEMLNHGAELEDCKTKCHGLWVELKEKEAVCIDLRHELMVYKTKCSGMEECIMELTESQKAGFAREKTALERSAYFERSVKKVMSDERELRVQLGKVIENLKCGRKIAEDENEVLKTKLLELEEYKLKYHGLCKEIKEKEMECAGVMENLMLTKVALDHELEDCRTKCSGMEEKIMALTKEGKIMSEREKTANEKISYLEEVIKKMKSDEADLCAQLKGENRVLECREKRAEDEIEVLKMNFMTLKKELEDYTSKCHGLSKLVKVKEMERVGTESQLKELSESKTGLENELKEYEIMCNRLSEQIIKSLEDKRIASERDKEDKERIIKLEEEIKKMGSDLREKCVEFSKEIIDLKTVNQRAEEEMEIWKKKYTDLECEKRRADGEIELVKKKCRELEIQASEMLNHGELEDYKTKCHGLSAELKVKEMECVSFEGKLKNLMSTKVALDHELEDYKTTCSRMKEEITGLTNVGKIMSEREKTSHDRIAYFEELVKKMESDEKDMLVQLKNENMVLERGKRRAEDETENWKKRFMELEMGLGSLQKEYGYDDICEKYMDEYISRKMDGRVNAASVAHLTKSGKVLSPASLPTTDFSSFHEMLFRDVHVSDTPTTKNQFDHSLDFKVEKNNICSDTKVELVSEAKQQPGSETRGSCKENLVLLKQDSVTTSSICIIEIEDDVIEVSDGEDEKEIPPTHTCNNKGEDIDHASTDGTLKTLNKYLKRPLSVWGSLDKNIQFSSTMKRCKVSTSRSVSQEDDKFPNIEI